jgi:hypothetical protein
LILKSKFANKHLKSYIEKKTDEMQPDSKHYDSVLVNRSTQDILQEYEANPFFRAKFNYLLKSRGLTHQGTSGNNK